MFSLVPTVIKFFESISNFFPTFSGKYVMGMKLGFLETFERHSESEVIFKLLVITCPDRF